ncbi:MAG: hypothetical protein OXI39_07485 [Gemmatimonadota bacterium]|uniref:leishmanolysin-related zinc metalloendopeptidase n=1 Tax=Candidatus Palauibacter scopulicola TaxID=3056741 RepID=UPI002384332A|nr:leishmanolysin-related zinc metalloendopeptidase [Candidatus Palauibacter scopulicola]MDE2662829.1 hypothetical protein [Candidatus Palauibacter scopulicola]
MLVAAWAAACGDGSTDLPLTHAPRAIGVLPDLELPRGESALVEVSGLFSDADGDVLSYEVRSSAPGVVAAEVSGGTVRLVALAHGMATVAITARDPQGRAAALRFEVTVPNRFDIEVRFDSTATEPRRAVVLAAAELWMSVLADTELPEVPVDDRIECYGAHTAEPVGSVDDLMILVEFRDIDGPGRTLAQAGVCRLREGSMLPFASVAFFDVSDFGGLIDSGDATELAVHEIAHALGFGLLWRPLGLLRDPALGVGAIDAHFVGPEAVAAFDAAGGTEYTGGAKVPVENLGGAGSANLHWRGAVLRGELMRPLNRIGVRETLSAITIRSLADLGYVVDASLAEPYLLPGVGAADEEPGRVVDLGDDVLRGPVQVVDAQGRVVRVLRDRSPG